MLLVHGARIHIALNPSHISWLAC